MDEFDEIAARLITDPDLRAAWNAAVEEITAAVMRDSRLRARVYGHAGPGTVIACVGGKTYRSRPGRGLPAAVERQLAERHHTVSADPRALYEHSRWHKAALVINSGIRSELAHDDGLFTPGVAERGKRRMDAVNAILGPVRGGWNALVAYSQARNEQFATSHWHAATAHLTSERDTSAVGRFLSMWFDPR